MNFSVFGGLQLAGLLAWCSAETFPSAMGGQWS
jgi:hypothetical protein